MMSYRFRQNILGPLVVAWLVITVAGVVVHTLVGDRLAASLRASAQAAAVSSGLERLYSSLLDAESGQRGFLLTGNETNLASFKSTQTSVAADFSSLTPLIGKDTAMQNDLLELRGLVQSKLEEIQDSIKLRKDKGLAAAAESVNTGNGGSNMDRIRKLISRMDQKQQDILAEAGQAVPRRMAWVQFSELFTGFLGMGAGLMALYLLRMSQAREREQRKLLDDKLRAEKIVAEKSAFLANISHEIRTPMNAILGFGELLECESLTPGQAQYVKSIRQSGMSLLQLINDVLDLSKLEAGKLDIHHEPTDLMEICNFLQTMFSQQAAAKSLQLKFDTTGVPNALLLDRLRLRQVLVNLVGNAVKFTTEGHVATRAEWTQDTGDGSRGTLLIHVEDTGVGVSPEKQEEIFKPFVQSESSSSRVNEGTGLGLHIVQRLTQIMGGSITVESAPGRGSTFHLQFPEVSLSARLPVTDSADETATVDFNDFAIATLLAVDDNETNRDLIAGIFERSHHRLLLARDGRETLAAIADARPNLVLLDIRMPVMDGHAVLAAIRKLPGQELLPVIAVTASSQEGEERELRDRFSGCIRKPFNRLTLYKELSQFLPKDAKKREPGEGTGGARVDAGNEPATGHPARKAADWEALVAELRALQDSSWAGLRDSIAINETRAFARKLQTLSRPTQCGPLAAYADTLTVHAQNYAVRDLEKLLAEFPALLQNIETQTAPKTNA